MRLILVCTLALVGCGSSVSGGMGGGSAGGGAGGGGGAAGGGVGGGGGSGGGIAAGGGAGGGSTGGGVGGSGGSGGLGGGGTATGGGSGGGSSSADGGHWTPAVKASWQWQLTGTLDLTVDAGIYDIDLFDTQAAAITQLHNQGRKVICYVDTAYEPGRPDSNQFTAAVLGNGIVGWPGQKWVDFRTPLVRGIIKARFDLAKTKGCDGLEPDDVDAINNNPGFPLTAADQLDFSRFLAIEGHARGLAVGLKNNLDQVAMLVPDFDFAVNEECVKFNECARVSPFISAGKPVFHAEYEPASKLAQICGVTGPLQFSTLLKNLSLDAYRLTCP